MVRPSPSVVIIAGEASGDLYAACLAARLKDMAPAIGIWGVGGRRMREVGVEVVYDSSSWSAIGAAEAVRVVPRVLKAFIKLRADLRAHAPDVLVLVDFGTFNVRIGKHLRPLGTKVLYYFPPGSWCREALYERLRGAVDVVVTPFPWSAQALREQGFEAEFFGHPLLDIAKPSMPRNVFCERFGLDAGRPTVGLLPGSRTQEIAHNLPALVVAAARLSDSVPGLQFCIPLAPSVSFGAVAEELAGVPWVKIESYRAENDGGSSVGRVSPLRISDGVRAIARQDRFTPPSSRFHVKLLSGNVYDVLAHSRAAVVTSGTATVEAAILGCPMVIIYRGSRLTALEFKLRRGRIKFIGMPNIILDKMVCPELIHNEASPGRISELMLRLISESPERAEMLNGLAEVKAVLGGPGAVDKTAGLVLELLGAAPAVSGVRRQHDKNAAE